MLDSKVMLQLKSAVRRLLILDYDGTLVPFNTIPDRALPSENVIGLLQRISSDPRTVMYIITGRMYLDIDRFVGHLPVNIIAEHGLMRKQGAIWHEEVCGDISWKQEVNGILKMAAIAAPESFIEEKKCALAWHYRNADSEKGMETAGSLLQNLEQLKGKFPIRIIAGNKVVEVMPAVIDKGRASLKIASEANYDYILCIGDDRTDEDMFSALSGLDEAITVKVGDGKTSAKFRIGSVNEVIELLCELYQD